MTAPSKRSPSPSSSRVPTAAIRPSSTTTAPSAIGSSSIGRTQSAEYTVTAGEASTPPAAKPLADAVRPHHLVVLVLDDVAVPHVEPGEVEPRLDPSDLLRIGDHRVLVAGLPALRLPQIAVERLSVHHLEHHLVDVDRVRVLREVPELPDLGRADRRVLGDGIHPHPRDALAALEDSEQCGDRRLVELPELRRRLVERELPGPRGC